MPLGSFIHIEGGEKWNCGRWGSVYVTGAALSLPGRSTGWVQDDTSSARVASSVARRAIMGWFCRDISALALVDGLLRFSTQYTVKRI